MSATQKHEREVLKVLRALHPQLRADIVPKGGHKTLVVSVGDVEIRRPISSSPSDGEVLPLIFRRVIRRALQEQGVTLPITPEKS